MDSGDTSPTAKRMRLEPSAVGSEARSNDVKEKENRSVETISLKDDSMEDGKEETSSVKDGKEETCSVEDGSSEDSLVEDDASEDCSVEDDYSEDSMEEDGHDEDGSSEDACASDSADCMDGRMHTDLERGRSNANDSAVHLLFSRLTEQLAEVIGRMDKLEADLLDRMEKLEAEVLGRMDKLETAHGYYKPGDTGYYLDGVAHSQSMQRFQLAPMQYPQQTEGDKQDSQPPRPQYHVVASVERWTQPAFAILAAHGYQVPQDFQPRDQQPPQFYAMQPHAAASSQGVPASASQGPPAPPLAPPKPNQKSIVPPATSVPQQYHGLTNNGMGFVPKVYPKPEGYNGPDLTRNGPGFVPKHPTYQQPEGYNGPPQRHQEQAPRSSVLQDSHSAFGNGWNQMAHVSVPETAPRPPPPTPPPPPPASSGLPEKVAAPPARSPVSSDRANLLQEIRVGATLKHVRPPSERPPLGAGTVVSQDSVTAKLKQSTQLGHMNASDSGNQKSTSNQTDMHRGIARSLAMAVAQRRKKLRSSNNSEETVDENDSEWEEK